MTCLVQSNAQRVLDIRLENADGGTSSVCGIGDLPGTTKLVYSLAPGDNIYGVQACYRRGVMVGVTFSSAGGPLMCGNPQDPDATCEATVAKELAPMAGISGQCNSDGITKITQVCFNPLYVNPIIPVVGKQHVCPALPALWFPARLHNWMLGAACGVVGFMHRADGEIRSSRQPLLRASLPGASSASCTLPPIHYQCASLLLHCSLPAWAGPIECSGALHILPAQHVQPWRPASRVPAMPRGAGNHRSGCKSVW